jgi:hypothetical protein
VADGERPDLLSYETPETRREMPGRVPDGYLGHRSDALAEGEQTGSTANPLQMMVVWVAAFVALLMGLLRSVGGWLRSLGV